MGAKGSSTRDGWYLTIAVLSFCVGVIFLGAMILIRPFSDDDSSNLPSAEAASVPVADTGSSEGQEGASGKTHRPTSVVEALRDDALAKNKKFLLRHHRNRKLKVTPSSYECDSAETEESEEKLEHTKKIISTLQSEEAPQ